LPLDSSNVIAYDLLFSGSEERSPKARVRRIESTAYSNSYKKYFSSYESERGIFAFLLATRIRLDTVPLGACRSKDERRTSRRRSVEEAVV